MTRDFINSLKSTNVKFGLNEAKWLWLDSQIEAIEPLIDNRIANSLFCDGLTASRVEKLNTLKAEKENLKIDSNIIMDLMIALSNNNA